MKHEGKCRHLHGHRYVFDFTCEGVKDNVGRIIDFGKVKEIVGGWLDTNLDHGFIAQKGDSIVKYLEETGGKLYLVDFSPTAENLAEHVLGKARELLGPLGITVVHLRVYETPNCWAGAS